jgi:hypothetical protein
MFISNHKVCMVLLLGIVDAFMCLRNILAHASVSFIICSKYLPLYGTIFPVLDYAKSFLLSFGFVGPRYDKLFFMLI